VVSDAERLKEMLDLSGGGRRVPLISDGDDVVIGFNGRS
jgi:hypothetical protein